MLLRDLIKLACQHVLLARHRSAQHQFLALINNVAEILLPSGKARIEVFKPMMALVVHEDGIEQVGELVAGGAVDRPVPMQPFLAGQDLFRN